MFGCCSYPESNLGDFSDFLNPGGVPIWQQLGFTSKAAWKQAGQPTNGATVGTPVFTPPPGLPSIPGSSSAAGGDGGASGGAVPAAGGAAPTSGSLLSNIPSSWFLIGGAIILLMVMKK